MNLDTSTQSGGWVTILKNKYLLRLIKSLKFKNFMTTFFIAIVPLSIFSTIVLNLYDRLSYENKVSTIKEYSTTIINKISTLGIVSQDAIKDFETEIQYFSSMYDGRVLIIDKNLRVILDTFGLEKGKTLISEEAVNTIRDKGNTYRNREKHYVELTLQIKNHETESIIGIMILSFSLTEIHNVTEKLRYISFTMSIIIAVITFIYAMFSTYITSQKISKMINDIDRITLGDEENIVRKYSYTELDTISRSINKLLSKIRKLERGREEFVSNVSHELKTPMTSIKVLADSLINEPNASIEMYREFMIDINNEIERENKIINDLLSLVKLDKKNTSLNISQVDLNDLLEQILRRLQPIARKSNIELVFESFRNVNADVDEVKLSLAISNLIENAIKYNIDGGWVRVSLNADHKFFFVKVADSGIGIPTEEQGQIFERFYRVDKARSRGTGGTGLGLSITKKAILMHNGEIRLYSKEGEGSTFTIRIPLVYISPKNDMIKKKERGFRLAKL